MTPAEQLAVAEAELADHNALAEELSALIAAKRKERDALDVEIGALTKQYESTGAGWNKYGNIQAAERRVEAARRRIADESAPKVQVNRYGKIEEWVLVAATPSQVKARFPGEVHPFLFRREPRGWTCHLGTLVNYDHEAAMRWYAAQKKEKA